jgi:serine/threonine protein kinase
MAVYRPDDFLTRLKSSGLVGLDQLEAARRRVARMAKDIPPSSFMWADALVGLGLMTPYQVQQLMAGTSNGLSLGDYVVVEEIGGGGLGHVLHAKRRAGRDEVAVKVMREGVASRVQLLDGWQERMDRVGRVDHPNVVRVRETSPSEERGPVVISDFVQGSDVRTLTANRGRLHASETIRIARQVCEGLAYSHQMGLAHRNIKPANILVAHDGTTRLADFGLIRVTADGNLGALGENASIWDYVAPEEALRQSGIDPRSDLYSLGCTLYHMLTGRAPFPARGALAKLSAHQASMAPSVRQLAPDVPESVSQIVAKLMAKRPVDRFPSAMAVSEALREATVRRVASGPAGIDLARWIPAGGFTRRRPVRRRWLRRLAIAVGVAGAGIAMLSMLLGR